MPDNIPQIVKNDPWLDPFKGVIVSRQSKAAEREKSLIASNQSLPDFANGYRYFGMHDNGTEWVFREWAPNATRIFLIGEFNNWKETDEYSLNRLKNGVWEIVLPKDSLHHRDLFKLSVYWEGGQGYRIPSYSRRVVQHEENNVFDAQVWQPPVPYKWKREKFAGITEAPLIYEAHVGMATEKENVGTFSEFREEVLPRIKKAGYNTLQLMAIQEHPYYGSFGYHVSNFFAVSSRFGTPDELKQLVDEAHSQGMAVIMDLVHSHSVKNEVEGLGRFDGTPYLYFHDGYRREHVAWDSLCFDYGKNEVLHFLLSNCKFWLDEYKFDGFRFDGVTSMLYYDHGLSRNFTNYSMYFDNQQDEDAIIYLKLANKLIHEFHPGAITIAEEMSGMPGLAEPLENGGFGFDYRLAMGIPDYWIKIIKEQPDEGWNVSELYYELTSKRKDEKTIAYAESHDQALVGDKTIIFRLIDKEMYYHMNKTSKNLIIDRGMALHKMIRLVTLATSGGGYLNFMGNEYGHPEWIDFPREGNNWSYKYARRQWSLMDNPDLRYHFLSDFDRDMLELIKSEKCLEQPYCYLRVNNQPDQVLAFERKDMLFIFNFSPSHSFTGYGINVRPGKYKIVINTDSVKYGGFGLIDESILYYPERDSKVSRDNFLKLYLPARVGLVLKHIPTPDIYQI